MAGLVGPEERRDYTVVGDTVNIAARLMSAAPPRTVLVGEETYRATRRRVRYRAVAPIEAEGKDRPLPAWEAWRSAGAGGAAARDGAARRPRPRAGRAGRHLDEGLARGAAAPGQRAGRAGHRQVAPDRRVRAARAWRWATWRCCTGAACRTARRSATGRWPWRCARRPASRPRTTPSRRAAKLGDLVAAVIGRRAARATRARSSATWRC